VSPYYLKKAVEGRSTNTVLKLAEVLDVPPAEMFGCTLATATPIEPPDIDSEQLKRIMVAARMMAAQLAALVYVASNGSKVDPMALMAKLTALSIPRQSAAATTHNASALGDTRHRASTTPRHPIRRAPSRRH
jgi:hypothetical protein